jgi:hypothetical protein
MNLPSSPNILGYQGSLGPGAEGAKSVGPLNFDWTTTPISLNLRAAQTNANLISQVQSLYIDNGSNTSPVILTMPNGQRVIFPAKSQGYIPILLGTPVIFSAASIGGAGQSTAIFLLNYQVDSVIWAVA